MTFKGFIHPKAPLRVILYFLMLKGGTVSTSQEILLSPMISQSSQCGQKLRISFFVEFTAGLAINAVLALYNSLQVS